MSLTELAAHYAPHLACVDEHMAAGLRRWPWTHHDRMRQLVEDHLGQHGKRIRPLFTILCADLLGGDLDRTAPVGAALELYHSASLVLDDVQDNSSFRRGASTVHVTENVSNAINLAGVVRSFSYYPLHDATTLGAEEKLALHHEIDTMATLVPLGQSMEIGWHQGWYDDERFPYLDMIRLKTGAPFACAAASAAIVSGTDATTRDELRKLGFGLGCLYQLVDDFRDMFAAPPGTVPEDLAAGKPSRPLWILVEKLSADAATVDRVLRDFRFPGRDRNWIRDLMRELKVKETLDAEISDRAQELRTGFGHVAVASPALDRVHRFVDSCRLLARI